MNGQITKLIRRELSFLRSNPLYLLGSAGVMAFCSVFFLTFFSKGLPDEVPIGVVDLDCSYMSRELARQIDATQIGRSIDYATFEDARKDMESGRICGICVLPEGLYEDVSANRRPSVSYYINTLYYVGGSLAYKNLLQIMNIVNAAVQRKVLYAKGNNDRDAMNMIQSVAIDPHQIGNAYTNYGYYVTNVMLPGILGMVVIIVFIYSLGTELKYRSSRQLMELAGGSLIKALAGKIVVFTLLFSLLGFGMTELLYRWMHFPLAGSIWNMYLCVLLYVLASEAVAIFIFECLPIPRLALSVGALYSVLGISLSGFTLPLEAMPAWFQGPAQVFPLRHYFLFYTQEAIFGAGFAGWYREVIYLLLFLFVPIPLLPRLRNAYVNQNYPTD